MARVTLYLYGQPKRFNSKKAAKEFLMEGIMCSDGSEQERYVDCLMQLEYGSLKDLHNQNRLTTFETKS